MTARTAGRRRLSLSVRALTGVSGAALGLAACYSAGSGSAPPPASLYYPVGLAVSQGGEALYVANSDFDLQWNGGTLQSYDLSVIRQDTASLIDHNLNLGATSTTYKAIPWVYGDQPAGCPGVSLANPPVRPSGQVVPLGGACSPPVKSTDSRYYQAAAVIGAFATDLQLSADGTRLFAPVRGDGTLTWADLPGSGSCTKPISNPPVGAVGACVLSCGQDGANRCNATHHTGNDPNEPPGNTRKATLPGEPFGMAQSEDGKAIAITQQATQETSLLLSGLGAIPRDPPSMQFVLEGVPTGGNGIVPVPHDPDGVRRCEDVSDTYPCVRQAFLESSRSAGEVDLLRYYDDEGTGFHMQGPTLHRPFLVRESVIPITVNSPGTDQRGIAIDPTPRLKCKARAIAAAEAKKVAVDPGDIVACGQRPARVFIASRSPQSILFGTVGGPSLSGDGTYDADLIRLLGSVPVRQGPSRLYLAPVVDASGHYALKLFVVCYDAATLFVYDPDQIEALGQQAVPEAVLEVGRGPYAMAFDPFCNMKGPTGTGLVDASGQPVKSPLDCRRDGVFADVAVSEANAGTPSFLVPPGSSTDTPFGLRRYRFGYLTSFTDSFIQVLDLDDSLVPLPGAPAGAPAPSQETFEQIVFTLGQPTPPKGT